jgi:hypothetical protein
LERSAPSVSYTTLALSAPKKMMSPVCVAGGENLLAFLGEEFHDRRLRPSALGLLASLTLM